MKKILLLIALVWAAATASAQTMVVNIGDTVRIETEYVVSVHGGVWNRTGGLWYNSGDSLLITDTIRNSGGNTMFHIYYPNGSHMQPHGAVIMNGDQQNIDGPDVITFQNLRLRGNGKKTMDNDAITQDTLDLWNRELDTRTHTMFVVNDDVEAIQRVNGFVSSDSIGPNNPGGALSRATNSTGVYLFPVGDSLSVLRYRPIELRTATADSATYTVRFGNYLADYDEFYTGLKQDTVCRVNQDFFWRINRTFGSDPTDIRAYYDPIADTIHQHLGHYEQEWELIPGSVANAGSPLGYVEALGWNDFVTDGFALLRVNPRVYFDPIDDQFCSNFGAVTITGATPPGGVYYVDNIQLIDSVFYPGQFGPGQHIVKYVWTDSVGCFNAWVDTFNVINTPFAALTAVGPTTVCSGESVSVTATPFGPGYDVVWVVDGVPQPGLTGATQTFNSSVTVTIIVTDLTTGCIDTVNTPIVITIQQKPNPVINLTNLTYCNNDPAFPVPVSIVPQLPNTNSILYINDVPQTNPVINPANYAQAGVPETLQVFVVATTIYSTPTNLACADTSATALVVINPAPTASIVNLSGITAACSGVGIHLKAFPDNMLYEWSTGQTTQEVIITATANVYVTVTDPVTGCKDKTDSGLSLKLFITPKTELGNFPYEVCNDEPPFLLPGTFDYGVPVYYLDGVQIPNNTFNPALYAQNSSSQTVQVWYTATLTYPDYNLYCADTTFATITVYKKPKASIVVNGPTEICADQFVTLEAQPVGPEYTYEWSTGETTPTINVNTSQTVTLKVKGPGVCSDEADEPVTIKVNALPDVFLQASPLAAPYCPGTVVTLKTYNVQGYLYEWQKIEGTDITVLSSATHTVDVSEGGLYAVVVTDANLPTQCKHKETIFLDYIPTPVPVLTLSGSPDFCEGQSLTLVCEPAGMDYRWTKDGVALDSLPLNTDRITVTESGLYSVTVNPPACPGSLVTLSQPVTVTAFAAPRALCFAEPDTTTQDQIIQFTERAQTDTANGDFAVTWFWNFADGATSTEPNPKHSFAEVGNYPVTLTVTTLNGCVDVDTVWVTIVPEGLLIPTAFSPNDDALNDELVIWGPGIVEFNLIMLDRWGVEVWRTNTVTDYWQGQNKDGKQVPEGVYTYYVYARSHTGRIEVKKGGTVTLLR